jgi:sugar phosphate isomerase/epimerase
MPASSNAPAKTGVDLAFEAFTSIPDRLFELHVHDNHGGDSGSGKDEHLWPGDGTLDFKAVDAHIAALKTKPIGMLEIAYDLTSSNDEIIRRGTRATEIMSGL